MVNTVPPTSTKKLVSSVSEKSAIITFVSVRMIMPAIGELLGRSLSHEECLSIEKAVSGTDGVKGWHCLRTFKSGNDAYIEVHIKVDGNMNVCDAHRIATAAERHICGALPHMSVHATTHIEPAQGS